MSSGTLKFSTLGPRTVGSINYVGNRGYDLILANPYLNAFGFGDLPATAPDARVATVEQFTNNGYSNYNGITASIQQNMWRGLTGRLSYTYSHALDNVSNGGVLPYSVFDSILTQTDPTNPNATTDHQNFDLRHQLSANYVWELPIKSEHRALNALIGGWQVSGTFFWHSGYPFSIVDGLTAFNIAGQNMSLNGTPVATVLAQPNVSIPRNFGSGCAAAPCFTTADFATSTTFIGGSVGRNAFRGPGYFNTDFSLRKSFRLTEHLGFQVGANAFNVLNHTNFQNPVNTTTSVRSAIRRGGFATHNALRRLRRGSGRYAHRADHWKTNLLTSCTRSAEETKKGGPLAALFFVYSQSRYGEFVNFGA